MSSREIRRTLKVLFEPEAVIELRAFGDRGVVSGYYDDHDALTLEAARLDEQARAVYVTLNKVDPALLARAANRTRQRPTATTSDTDVIGRRWLPLDFDPIRPSGVSSTKEEKRASLLRARDVRDYLRGQGWPEPVVADSGNGAHLLYAVDLANDQESLQIVKDGLGALAFRFDDGDVRIDTGVHNAGRIWKLYGTTARKGDHTAERPHRLSKLLKTSEEEA